MSGFWLAVAAQVMWGVLPIYYIAFEQFPLLVIVSFRILFSLASFLLIVVFSKKLKQLLYYFTSLKTVLFLAICSFLLLCNWFLYVYALTIGRVLEGSLGYFIYPLVNVLIGVVFFKDLLNRLQKIGVVMALIAILYLCFFYGHFPWISFGLAFSFSCYGAIRKKVAQDLFLVSAAEMVFCSLPAIIILSQIDVFGNSAALTNWVALLLFGPFTAISLLLYLLAISKIPYSTIGMISYVGPSLQFAAGLLLGEKLDINKFLAFLLIWLALISYTKGSLAKQKT